MPVSLAEMFGMKKTATILTLLVLTFVQYSCKRDKLPAVTIPGALPPADHHASIRLKDVVETGSPTPLFHFDYNDSGYVTHIDYASGLFQYDVNYLQKKVSRMTNTPDHSLLTYQYATGRIGSILKRSAGGEKRWNYLLSYEGGKLASVKWVRYEAGGDSVLERQALLAYGPDGNLSSWKDYWRTGTSELSLIRTFLFKNYDSNVNVDDFYLLKTFFEDVLFLPGVKLQQNNPALVQILGAQNDYEIRYTYTIQDKHPVAKKGIFKQTRGNGSGTAVEQQTVFSYE
jgi:hypothetical protein